MQELENNTIRKRLAELDRAGFFARKGESAEEYFARADREAFARPSPDVSGDPDFADAVSIPKTVLREGAARTEEIFAFASTAVPGYYLKRGFGIFWGGCTVSDENGRVCFALRDSFRNRKKWFVYERAELLAHEQCHAARADLPDGPYEEVFAYMTSRKKLRRFLGGCFRSRLETGIFAGLILLLFTAEMVRFTGLWNTLPLTPFLLALLAGMAWALIRNHFVRRKLFTAEKNLKNAGIDNAMAALFRATDDEIQTIASAKRNELTEYLEKLEKSELRWTAALARFRRKK